MNKSFLPEAVFSHGIYHIISKQTRTLSKYLILYKIEVENMFSKEINTDLRIYSIY